MQHWSNIQLRNTLQWRELDLIPNERREAIIERLLADGFETGQRNRPSSTQSSREAQRAEAVGREEAAAQEQRQAEAIRSEKAGGAEPNLPKLPCTLHGLWPLDIVSLCVCARACGTTWQQRPRSLKRCSGQRAGIHSCV